MLKHKTALLLDLDGVVLYQPHMMRHISHKSARFVSEVLRVPLSDAQEINQVLYTEFGHTLKGLQKVYGVRQTYADFASFVYDRATMDAMRTCADDAVMTTRSDQTARLARLCLQQDIPMYLFSNAPSKWCFAALRLMHLLGPRAIPETNVLCSDHPVFTDRSSMKPNEQVYDNVEMHLQQTLHDADVDMVFVDDTFGNLVPVISKSHWKPVLFKNGLMRTPCINTPKLHTVYNMTEVGSLLEEAINARTR